MKVSDYIFSRLAEHGVRHVFLFTGGGAMYLNEALGKEKGIRYVCNHHEQACAMAAEGYARVSGEIGVICVTTGPGGINSLNGVFGAWTDSIPLLVISGQVKRETCMAFASVPGLRQLGDQETDIISMAKNITKYAVLVKEPESIRYHLEKALFLATSGRPGPCWLDVPIDVQASLVNESMLSAYNPEEDPPDFNLEELENQVCHTLSRIRGAERPVILVGGGIWAARAKNVFQKVIHELGIPVVTEFTTPDLLGSEDPLFCGRPGSMGERAGNFVVQNADLLLTIGCRLNIRQVSYNWGRFASHAYKIQVDIDKAELTKPTVKPDFPIHCDAKIFLEEMNRQIDREGFNPSNHKEWLAWCKARLARYPVLLSIHKQAKDKRINPYHFLDALSRQWRDDEVVVCANGAAFVQTFQVAKIKEGQRVFTNSGCTSMGYDLPAAIGAAFANRGKRVICLAGDGSIMLNLQELQTVVHHQLPIKIFVLNNDGYLSIRQTQMSFFQHLVGESSASGISFPDMVRVAEAFGIKAVRIEGPEFEPEIDRAINEQGPVLCEVMLDPRQQFEPKLSSKQLPTGQIISPPLEDMYPFLEREELQSNMFTPVQSD